MIYQRLLQPPTSSFFLFGARGTGKSTWLKTHFNHAAAYIDLLDEQKYQAYLGDVGLFSREIEIHPSGSWIIVDEVQRLPSLLNEVHRTIEEKKFKFALSGSSARKLKRSGVNLLAGRALLKSMHPFLPAELGNDFDLTAALQFGTIPVVWQADNRLETLEAYTQAYLKEEIQVEAIVRNLPSFARFLPVAALFHGQVINVTGLGRDCGVHRNTVASYLEVLEDTLLAFRVPGYEAKLRVKERKQPKFYFIDAGLVRALKKHRGSIAEEEKGALFEGLIANLLRSHNAYQRFYDDIFYWSSASHRTEVDFLLKQGDALLAIEVKSSTKVSSKDFKGLKTIGELPNVKERVLVYLGETAQRTPDGIDILPLADFFQRIETWQA